MSSWSQNEENDYFLMGHMAGVIQLSLVMGPEVLHILDNTRAQCLLLVTPNSLSRYWEPEQTIPCLHEILLFMTSSFFAANYHLEALFLSNHNSLSSYQAAKHMIPCQQVRVLFLYFSAAKDSWLQA